MKWINHQIVTGVAMYAITDDLLLASASVLGAVIPDKIEGNPWQKRRPWRWNLTHRGWSHCPLIYLLLMGAIYLGVGRETLVSVSTIFQNTIMVRKLQKEQINMMIVIILIWFLL